MREVRMVDGRATVPGEATGAQRRWLVLVLVCTAQFMCVLDDTIVNVALPSIQAGLGFPDSTLSWVLGGYLVTFGGLLLLGGRAADLFVRRTVFLTGLVVFGAASLACGLARTPLMLVLSRVVQGAGAAAMSAAALAILTVTFTGADRSRAFGVWGGLSGVAGALGMLVGGALTTAVSWRWVFLVNVPVALVVAVLSLRAVPATRAGTRRALDPFGAVTVTGGLGLLLFAIGRVPTAGWGAPATVGCLAGAVVLFGAFLVVEARHPAPLLPLGLFRRRPLTGGVVCGLLLAGAMLGTFLFLTLYLQRVLGYSAFQAGLGYLPLAAAVIVTANVTARLLPRLGGRPPLLAGFAVLAGALLWFARLPVHGTYLADVCGPAVLAGLGLGATLVSVVSTATGGARDADEAGVVSGLVNTTQQVGGALGIAVLSTVAFAHAAVPGAAALTEGFRLAFLLAAAVAAAGFLAALLLTGRR